MLSGKPQLSLNEFFLALALLLSFGFLFMKCLSTHFNIVKTESVEGKRRSAAVLMMFELEMRKVAAIPLKACKKIDQFQFTKLEKFHTVKASSSVLSSPA